MFLSDLVNKEILAGKAPKGICRGVGISLKSHAVKYLLCASSPSSNDTDFSALTSAVTEVSEEIYLSKLRPVFPKSCVRVFLGRPVYAFDGAYLGEIVDVEMQNFTATRVFTSQNATYPITAVTACQDAVILKREQPYPLGQRVPTPFLCLLTDKKDFVVTKPILRAAIQKSCLIQFTLALPPFQRNG